jgi:hypothetical protein
MSLPPVLAVNGSRYACIEGDAMPMEFSQMNSADQARFFNDLGAMVKQWPTYNFGETQWSDMAPKLDENGRGVLRSIAQFLETQ